jgi:hypothetical protein
MLLMVFGVRKNLCYPTNSHAVLSEQQQAGGKF